MFICTLSVLINMYTTGNIPTEDEPVACERTGEALQVVSSGISLIKRIS